LAECEDAGGKLAEGDEPVCFQSGVEDLHPARARNGPYSRSSV
jgi:hypothetical protein